MKKLILTILVLSLMAVPAFAGPTFTFTKAELMSMTELDQSPSPDGGSVFINLSVVTDVEATFIGDGAQQLTGIVGFGGNLGDGLSSPSEAWIKIGLSGLSLDLSGDNDFKLVMANDNNNDTWQGALFVDGVMSSFTTIAAGSSALLTYDISAINSASSIGFVVKGTVDDNYHVSIIPVPAPVAVLLGSLGCGLVGWLRRRRSL